MLEKKPSTLLDQVKEKIRFLHYSRETEKSYVHWIRRYILFNVNTTMIVALGVLPLATLVLNKGGHGVKSPLDNLAN